MIKPMTAPLYQFVLTEEEKAELCTVPLFEQASWIKALATRKRPAAIPAPPEEK